MVESLVGMFGGRSVFGHGRYRPAEKECVSSLKVNLSIGLFISQSGLLCCLEVL